MTARVLGCLVLAALCPPFTAAGQEPPPAAPAGVVPPDQNLPPHIRKLTGFGERAEFSLDGKRVLFLSKTFGDAMEIDLATGVIRNLTAHFPHFGFTRALYLANGHILLSGPTEFDPANVGAARTNCWLFVLDPSCTRAGCRSSPISGRSSKSRPPLQNHPGAAELSSASGAGADLQRIRLPAVGSLRCRAHNGQADEPFGTRIP